MSDRESDFPIIRASDINQYLYCRKAWWLRRVRGVRSDHSSALAAGTAFHRRHERQVRWAARLSRLGMILILAALLLLGYWYVMSG